MIIQPVIGKEYIFTSTGGGFGGKQIRVRVTGRIRGLISTEGVDDKRRRDVSYKRLSGIE